jgi:hypothetical protein
LSVTLLPKTLLGLHAEAVRKQFRKRSRAGTKRQDAAFEQTNIGSWKAKNAFPPELPSSCANSRTQHEHPFPHSIEVLVKEPAPR